MYLDHEINKNTTATKISVYIVQDTRSSFLLIQYIDIDITKPYGGTIRYIGLNMCEQKMCGKGSFLQYNA